MRKNLGKWLAQLEIEEGGVANRPMEEDPGGYTKFGITGATLSAELGRKVTLADFNALTLEGAQQIASRWYWTPVQADQLPGGLDVAVADFCFHSGEARASKALQTVLGVKVDGDIGPATLEAARKCNLPSAINTLMDNRWLWLTGRSNYETNKNGWKNRITHIRKLALELAEPIPPIPGTKPMAQSRIAWGSAVSAATAAAGAAAVMADQSKSIEEPVGKVLAAVGIDPALAGVVAFVIIAAASGFAWLARRDDHKAAKAIEAAS